MSSKLYTRSSVHDFRLQREKTEFDIQPITKFNVQENELLDTVYLPRPQSKVSRPLVHLKFERSSTKPQLFKKSLPWWLDFSSTKLKIVLATGGLITIAIILAVVLTLGSIRTDNRELICGNGYTAVVNTITNKKTCEYNTCLCPDGIPAGDLSFYTINSPNFEYCQINNNQECSSCNRKYHKQELSITDVITGLSIQQSICSKNNCFCNYGQVNENLCLSDNIEICLKSSCVTGTSFNQDTHICEINNCFCGNGDKVVGNVTNPDNGQNYVCLEDGQESCYGGD